MSTGQIAHVFFPFTCELKGRSDKFAQEHCLPCRGRFFGRVLGQGQPTNAWKRAASRRQLFPEVFSLFFLFFLAG